MNCFFHSLTRRPFCLDAPALVVSQGVMLLLLFPGVSASLCSDPLCSDLLLLFYEVSADSPTWRPWTPNIGQTILRTRDFFKLSFKMRIRISTRESVHPSDTTLAPLPGNQSLCYCFMWIVIISIVHWKCMRLHWPGVASVWALISLILPILISFLENPHGLKYSVMDILSNLIRA